MNCPHCSRSIHFEEQDSAVYGDEQGGDGVSIDSGFCPACHQLIVLYRRGIYDDSSGGYRSLSQITHEEVIYPRQSARAPLPPEVPADVRRDFDEAASVLQPSPKASAAISRRLLQHILRDQWGIQRSGLAQEIDDFVSRGDIPSHLSKAVDAVRNIGNFAAHPTKDQNSGIIAEVEPGEAEWLIEVLESLCDFAYVQPRRLDQRRQALNAKLKALGKPPMK